MLNNIQIIQGTERICTERIPKSAEISTEMQKDFEKLKIFFRHHKLSAIFHRNNFNAKHSSLHYFLLYGLCVNILIEHVIYGICV